VLKDFLEHNASEVRNMLFGWDWDEAKDVWQEEAREDGVARGIAIGRDEGVAIGEARGIAIGRDEGVAIGRNEGVAIGEARGETKGVLRTARQMKAKGFATAVICEITGLSEAEIEELS
jgi:flagellar biosynthesis/type III secretory pathway protein FliH